VLTLGDFDLRLVDTWTVYSMNDAYEETEDGYAVDAWFKHDWKPLSAEDVERGLDLLRWSRADLLAVAAVLSQAQLDVKSPGERWSIRGILRHVANAEWWYLDRLGLAAGPRAAHSHGSRRGFGFSRMPGQPGGWPAGAGDRAC